MEGSSSFSGSRTHSITHGKFSLAPGRSNNKRVIINVGGVKYETFKSTLRAIPDTRLSWLTEAQGHNPDYDPASGEYFFDRHPGVFNMILNYYRTGKLHAPTDVCGPLFEEELAFWGMDEKQIEPCCWPTYRAHRDAQETLAEFDSDHGDDSADEEEEEEIARRFGIVEQAREEKQGFARWQPRVWHLLEDPNSSQAAKVVAMISVVFVLLFIAIFVAESHVLFRDFRPDVNATVSGGMTVRELQLATRPKLWLTVLEYTCVAYFTLELLLRTIFCPDKGVYFRHLLTWVDILSVLPVYVYEIIILAEDSSMRDSMAVYVLKSLRVIRIFRILRLTRYFSGLKILGHTLKASAKELLLMILVLCIGVLVFACFIFYVEQVEEGEKNDFKNIPIGFWWAVVTMTTLGYGDMYPRTALGYIVGAICALCGLLMLALPVPVIVNNFTLYYSHAQAKLKLPQKKKNVLVGAADALKNTDTTESSLDVSSHDQQGSQGSQSSMDSSTSVSVDTKDVKEVAVRKCSHDSAEDSVDSGFKTGSASTTGDNLGISVIFTDELTTTSSPSRLPPTPQSPDLFPLTDSNRTSCKRSSVNTAPRGSFRKGSLANSRRRSLRPASMRVDIVDVDV